MSPRPEEPRPRPPVPNPAVVASARSTADAIAQALGSKTVVELDAAVDLTSPVPAGAPPDAGQASLVRPFTVSGRGQGWTQVATPYVATPAVLGLYRLSAATFAAGSDILSSRRDLQRDRTRHRVQGRLPAGHGAGVRAAAELHLGAQHADHPEGHDRQRIHRRTGRLAGPGQAADHRRRRSPMPATAPPRPGSPSRPGPVPTTACSSCATTRRWPARSWRSACWP